MPFVYPLFSGSSGNCTLILSKDAAILIDAGVSCRSITAALSEMGTSVSKIDAVFLTHEHIDHVKGLMTLWKKYRIPMFGSACTLQNLFENRLLPPDAEVTVIDKPIHIKDLTITPFPTSHDCPESLGYRIEAEDGSLAGIATDLGKMTPQVRDQLSGCETVMLESNYDTAMLQCSSYPYYLIRRIRSETGHLSNEECAAELAGFVQSGARQLILAHLSRENNLPELALETSRQILEECGFLEGRDYTLQAADRNILDSALKTMTSAAADTSKEENLL